VTGRSLLTGVTALLSLIALGASCRADEFENVRDRIHQYFRVGLLQAKLTAPVEDPTAIALNSVQVAWSVGV
jgi:hypothetical protein